MGNNKIKTQMKFVLALLAFVAAQDDEEAEEGAAVDCMADGCPEGECCGWSKPDEPEAEEGEGEEEEGGDEKEGDDYPPASCHAEGDFTTTNDDQEVAMGHHCKGAQSLAAGIAAFAVAAL